MFHLHDVIGHKNAQFTSRIKRKNGNAPLLNRVCMKKYEFVASPCVAVYYSFLKAMLFPLVLNIDMYSILYTPFIWHECNSFCNNKKN